MLLQPRHFVRLYDDRYRDPSGEKSGFALVAKLSLDIGAYMPTRSSDVLIGVEYLRKISLKHRLKYEDFGAIQELLDDSYCVQEKPHHLTFMGYRSGTSDAFSLVIKAARDGEETWVATLHREKPARFASKLRRHKIIRELNRDFDE